MQSLAQLAAGAALSIVAATGASAAVLYGTTGSGGTVSNLITIDLTTGATTLIGSIGFPVNGLTYDATTGTLYGSSATPDGEIGLITIDAATGAGTLVGPFNSLAAGCFDRNVLLASNSAGNLYGWCEPISDDLMSIDKTTGQATIVGESGIGGLDGTLAHSLSFANNDVLYLYNFDAFTYTIDTVTGAASFVGVPAGSLGPAHHGDFNPDNDLFYGLPGGSFSGLSDRIDIYDLTGAFAYVSSVTLDRADLFTVAFAPTAVPEPSTAIVALGLAALGWAGRRRKG